MIKHLALVLPLALFGCTTDNTDANDPNGDGSNSGGPEGGGDIDTDYNHNAGWPSSGFPNRNPDDEITGNISSGNTIDISWAATAEGNYCWVGTENDNFNGAHVFHELTQPAGTDIFLLLEPENNQTDLSLYAMQFGSGDRSTPPDISTPPFSCDTAFDQESDNNPGQGEALYLPNYLDFDVLVAVAGTDGETSGGYTLKIWYEDGNMHDTGR